MGLAAPNLSKTPEKLAMKPLHLLVPALLAFAPALAPSVARAQDEESEDDRPSRSSDKPVREIVKGFYARANVGGAFFLGKLSGFVNPGTFSSLSVGQDFVDTESMSLAWEVGFSQGVHNGCYFEAQAQLACTGNKGGTVLSPFIQGDVRSYILGAGLEASFYPARRFGVGITAGGGVLFSPLLMIEEFYYTDVVQKSWGGQDGGFHEGPHPIVRAGPTFEYYTKLSHFSVGVDANVFYALGFDLGADVTGYMKYTF